MIELRSSLNASECPESMKKIASRGIGFLDKKKTVVWDFQKTFF